MSAEIVDHPALRAVSEHAPRLFVDEELAAADLWPLGRRLRLLIALAVLAWMLVGGFVWAIGRAFGFA